jgi:prepilin-type N-terminal cleavage/methylation domain-containing protein
MEVHMRRAFTLIELLVVIAIIAILAAILFPVFAQAKEAAKKTKNLSGIKQMATSLMIYNTDADDLFPNAMSQRADTTWRWNTLHPVPHNWKLDGTWDATSQEAARTWWANSIYPYVKNWEIYDDSGFPKTVNAADNADFGNPLASPKARNTLFTYNGLLHNVSSTEIASPSKLPLFWLGHGKSPYAGRGLSNPALVCSLAAVPCRFNPTSAPQTGGTSGGAWFWATGASGYVFGQGMNYSFSDSSAKFRNIGRVTGSYLLGNNPNTDYNNSPFAHILTGGRPETMWFCTAAGGTVSYACVFRPDQEFNL